MKRFKKLLSVILLVSLLCSVCTVNASAAFSDVPVNAWYGEAVNWCKENGIMSGTSDTTFAPNSIMNRAMLVTVLYRIEGRPPVEKNGKFSDIAPEAWYADAVSWASNESLVAGYGNGVFGPNDPLTREQFATILYHYAQHKNQDVSVGESINLRGYEDMMKVSEYAIPAMKWAVGSKIISGTTPTTLNPKGSATRAQAASILYRWLSDQEEPSPTPDNTPPASDNNPATPGNGGTNGTNRILIAYFSRTGENYSVGVISKGNTAIVAELIAEQTSGDLFEIVPVVPYPSDYEEMKAVATQERDSNARPAIANTVENWDNYDVVFLGYPIWYTDMPMIVYNFLESYDFSGKTVIPFNTHEGSGQSGTQSRIEAAIPTATVLNGLAIRGTTAQNDIASAKATVERWITDDLQDFLP